MQNKQINGVCPHLYSAGGYGSNYLGSLASVPRVFTTSNSVHSSPGTGAIGSLMPDVNKPISYSNINVEQLNETRAPQTQAYLQQLFSLPNTRYIAPQIDRTQQLQQQTQQNNNIEMSSMLQYTSNTQMLAPFQISTEAYRKLLQLRGMINQGEN